MGFIIWPFLRGENGGIEGGVKSGPLEIQNHLHVWKCESHMSQPLLLITYYLFWVDFLQVKTTTWQFCVHVTLWGWWVKTWPELNGCVKVTKPNVWGSKGHFVWITWTMILSWPKFQKILKRKKDMSQTHLRVQSGFISRGLTTTWNLKHPFINGCFTKHPLETGCFGFQVSKIPVVHSPSQEGTWRNMFFFLRLRDILGYFNNSRQFFGPHSPTYSSKKLFLNRKWQQIICMPNPH